MEKCPYIIKKLTTCGGQLHLQEEENMYHEEKQTKGLPQNYIRQFFRCDRCGRLLKRYFIWQEVEYYEK